MQRASLVLSSLKLSPEIDDLDRRVLSAWNAAVGKRIAAKTRAVALVRGRLTVEVEDSVWQQQLNKLCPFLLDNLERTLGPGVVGDITFKPMPARRPAAVAQHANGIADPVMSVLYERSQRRAG